MKKAIPAVVGAILSNITGHGAWILALVNFVWLLVKGTTLFSWWIPIGTAIAFVICLVTTLVFYLLFLTRD